MNFQRFAFLTSFTVLVGLNVAAKKLPEKLPAKAVVKRTYIDFSSNAKSTKPLSAVDRALKKSDADLQVARPKENAAAPKTATVVRSRKIIAAPKGDSAEPMASMAFVDKAKPVTPNVTQAPPAQMSSPKLFVGPPAPPEAPLSEQILDEEVVAEATTFVGPLLIEQNDIEAPSDSAPAALAKTEAAASSGPPKSPPSASPALSPEPTVLPSVATVQTKIDATLPSINGNRTLISLRTGLLRANYSKFDGRMSNGATSFGIGAARTYESSYGPVEARTAFDVFHASDQSVSVDNIRMLTVRTEAAYFFTQGQVRPAVSLGVAWSDTSIRSYRSIDGENVTVKTHAKSQGFALIPAVSVRADITRDFVIDLQGEYLGLISGEAAEATRGFAATLSAGLLF